MVSLPQSIMFLILLLAVSAEGAVLKPRQAPSNSNFPFPYPQEFPKPPYPNYPQVFPQPPYPSYPEGLPTFPNQNIPYFPKPPQQPSPNPQSPQRDTPVESSASTPIPIIKFEIQPNTGDGNYQYSYETGNGIVVEESGSQREVGEPPEAGTVAQGSYSYTDPNGNLIKVTYTADENGFVAQGDHLPTAPPIPPEILAALEKNAAEEAAQNAGEVPPPLLQYFRNVQTRTRPF